MNVDLWQQFTSEDGDPKYSVLSEETKAKAWYMSNLAVTQTYRKKGIARALVEAGETLVRSSHHVASTTLIRVHLIALQARNAKGKIIVEGRGDDMVRPLLHYVTMLSLLIHVS